MKKAIFITSLIFMLFGCVNVFKLSDLTPPNHHSNSASKLKAKELLQEMALAHKVTLWDSIGNYTVELQDDFYGFVGKQSSPFKEASATVKLDYISNEFSGQLEILTGKEKGNKWGFYQNQTFEIIDDKVNLKHNEDIQFWIPTYQYFLEFPSRILEADQADFVGTRDIDGVNAQCVLVSWVTLSAQKAIDQYLILLHPTTKRIIKIEFTIRDVNKFAKGGIYYNNYKEFYGIPIPTELPVESNLVKDSYLHKMHIKSIKTTQGLEAILKKVVVKDQSDNT